MTDMVKYEGGGELAAWSVMREQAKALVASKLLPRTVDTPEKAIAIIQTGRELGLGPMQALRSIHVIEGKPTMSSELIAGLVLARLPGSTLRVASTSNEECVVKAGRQGQEETEFRFSMTDARNAGLVGKDNWKKYPAAMLRARCLAAAARAIFPDATMGLYDPDELGAVTDERGAIVQHVETLQLPQVSPHDDGHPLNPDEGVYNDLIGSISCAERWLAEAKSYDDVLRLEKFMGGPGKPSPLTEAIQISYHAGTLLPEQRKEVNKRYKHIVYELTKPKGLLAKYPPPDAAASFVDEPNPEDDGR